MEQGKRQGIETGEWEKTRTSWAGIPEHGGAEEHNDGCWGPAGEVLHAGGPAPTRAAAQVQLLSLAALVQQVLGMLRELVCRAEGGAKELPAARTPWTFLPQPGEKRVGLWPKQPQQEVDTGAEAGGGPLKVKPGDFSSGSAAAGGRKGLRSEPFPKRPQAGCWCSSASVTHSFECCVRTKLCGACSGCAAIPWEARGKVSGVAILLGWTVCNNYFFFISPHCWNP